MAALYTNPRKRRSLTAAAQRRSDDGPSQPVAAAMSQKAQPTNRGVAELRKPPPRPLGTGAALKGGDLMTGQTGQNPNRPMTEFGRNMHPATRAGKKFKVGFTSDGRLVHLYGNDVPAAERRIVLPKTAGNLRAARRKRARG